MFDFSELKSEQIERIKQRDSFVNLSIVSVGVMVSATFSGDTIRYPILLAVPWVSIAFGWSFILNDVKISRLALYFSQVSSGSRDEEDWENWRARQRSTWLENPVIGAFVQFLTFFCPGVAAIIVYFFARIDEAIRMWEVLCCLLGLSLLALLAAAIFTAARMRIGRDQGST